MPFGANSRGADFPFGGTANNNQNNIGKSSSSPYNGIATHATGKSSPPGAPYTGAGTAGSKDFVSFGANDYSQIKIDGGTGSDGYIIAITAALQYEMAKQQFNTATNYYKTNFKDYQFVEQFYQPQWLAHKTQAFNTPYYAVDYNMPIGASLSRIKVYDEKWFQTRRRLHRYAVGLQMHTDYMYYQTRFKAAMTSYVAGIRVEDARKDWMDERVQQHKVHSLNFGINAGNIARAGLAQATGSKIGAYDEMGSRIGGLGNGLMKLHGYKQAQASVKAQMDNAALYGSNLAGGQ